MLVVLLISHVNFLGKPALLGPNTIDKMCLDHSYVLRAGPIYIPLEDFRL
jgi:hypothetical protein